MSCATIPRLTLRQQTFLALLVFGYTNTEIATILSLSPRQVGAWIARLCAQLNCVSREELRDWVQAVLEELAPDTELRVHPVTGQVVWWEQHMV